MIFHRVSGHDVDLEHRQSPKKNDPGCIRRGHQFSSPGDSIRVTPDRTMCRYRPAIIAVDQHIAYRCYWIACRLSPPAVPERIATASRQSKWADPRVGALGAALATAPFLICKTAPAWGAPRPLNLWGGFSPEWGHGDGGSPGSLQSLALALRTHRHEAESCRGKSPQRLHVLRRQPYRELCGNLALSSSPKHTVALVPWKGFGFIAQLPSC